MDLAAGAAKKGVHAAENAATKGLDAAVGVMDKGIDILETGAGLITKGVGMTAGPLVGGLQQHIILKMQPVTSPVMTPVRRVTARVQNLLAHNKSVIQGMPHTLPMFAAVVCMILMFLPLQNPRYAPWLFNSSVSLTCCAVIGWLLVLLANDYSRFRHGLLRPQRPRTLLFIFLIGALATTLRAVHLAVEPPPSVSISTEWLQRVFTGVTYFFFRFLGLDMWGFVLGFLGFALFISFGFFALCLCNCCGRVRIVQSVFRRRRDAMPFMDMVSNKFTLFSYNALLFVFPFSILSTFVIGGSVLIEPSRAFAPGGKPVSMSLLCSPAVATALYTLAAESVKEVGKAAATRGALPPSLGSEDRTRAIGTVALDLLMRASFEPIEIECDAMLVTRLPSLVPSVSLPRVAVALRDASSRAAGMSTDAFVYAQLVRQPASSSSSFAGSAQLFGEFEPRRPWCINGGCPPVLQEGCSTSARLTGLAVGAADPAAARAGVVVLEGLGLAANDGTSALCHGDYELWLTLHDRLDHHWDASSQYSGWTAHHTNESVPPYAELPPPRLATLINMRLVRSINHTSIETTQWSIDLPAFFNVTEKSRTASIVTYRQDAHLDTVYTTVITNTTSVGFDYVDNATAAELEGYSTLRTTSKVYGLNVSGADGSVPAWPLGNFTPTDSVVNQTNARPVAHLISFLKPPPAESVQVRQPFEVSLRVTTEVGVALAGEQVQAILLAPLGSGVRLARGSYGYTDEAGVATFNVTVDAGERGSYLLLFGSAGTMQVRPRQDTGMVLKAVQAGMASWRQFVEPYVGTASSIAEAARSGTLNDLLRQRVQEATQKELERMNADVRSHSRACAAPNPRYSRCPRYPATPLPPLHSLHPLPQPPTLPPLHPLPPLPPLPLLPPLPACPVLNGCRVSPRCSWVHRCARPLAQIESCLALTNYTEDQYGKEQVIQGNLELRGKPAESVSSLLNSLAVENLAYANFQRDQVLNEAPLAAACYDQTIVLANNLPATEEEAAGAGTALAASITKRLLADAGLGSLDSVLETFAPHAGDLKTHVDTLKRTMSLGKQAYEHLLGENGDDPSWKALLRVALLLAFGWGAPPAQLLKVESSVSAVELTAPFTGYSVFTSASSDPSRNELEGYPGTVASACVHEGYPSFMTPMRPPGEIRSPSALSQIGYALLDSARVVSALPLASPLWQPPLFADQNWMLDADSEYAANTAEWQYGSNLPHMGRFSPLCGASFLTSGQVLPGTAAEEGTLLALADQDVARVVADPLFPRYEQAAALVEALNGSTAAIATACKDTMAAWPSTLHLEALNASLHIDEELCRFAAYLGGRHGRRITRLLAAASEAAHEARAAAEAARAVNGTANGTATTIARLDNQTFNETVLLPPRPRYFSARPRLIVRGPSGEPLAGRHCTVAEVSSNTWFDLNIMEATVDSCGPSNERGEIEIIGLRVRGGATREITLEVRVEGARAALSVSTAWQPDGRLYYLSADQPTLSKLDLITLQGHDSVRLLAMMALPLFALNGRSYRNEPPHLVWRIAAVGSLTFFLWIAFTLFSRLVGPAGLDWHTQRRSSLFLMSANDITPITSSTDEPLPLVLVSLMLAIAGWLTACTLWLLVRHEVEGMTRLVKRTAALAQTLAVTALRRTSMMPLRRTSLATTNGAKSPSKGPPRFLAMSPPANDSVLSIISAASSLQVVDEVNGEASAPVVSTSPPSTPPPSPPPAEALAAPPADRRRPSCTARLCRCGWLPVRMVECLVMYCYLVGRKLCWCFMGVCLAKPKGQLKKLDAAPWIEVSPGWWAESEAARRSRSARNHVRTMLLGRKAYPIWKKRQHMSFCYPQRLWMALGLSLWIQVLVTLFFTNLVRWLASSLAAAQEFDAKVCIALRCSQGRIWTPPPEPPPPARALTPLVAWTPCAQMSAESQFQAAIDDTTRFAPLFRLVMLLVWGLLADQGRGQLVHSMLVTVGAIVPAVQSLVILCNWVHIFVLYRARMMKLRQGVYFFDRNLYLEHEASLYIGYQVAGMTLSGFFFMAAGVACAVPIGFVTILVLTTSRGAAYVQNSAAAAAIPLAWTLASIGVTVVFQQASNHYLFFTGKGSNKWLRHRFWYALYEYNMTFTNTLVGIAIMFTRFATWLVTGMFCLGRVDLTLMPGPGKLEHIDLSYRCYIALLRQDHRYNNPVSAVFFGLLTDHLVHFRHTRARRLLRRHFRLTWQLLVALSFLRDRVKPEHKQTVDRHNLRANVQGCT